MFDCCPSIAIISTIVVGLEVKAVDDVVGRERDVHGRWSQNARSMGYETIPPAYLQNNQVINNNVNYNMKKCHVERSYVAHP